MNEVLMKGALKMLKNFVSPEQIKEGVNGLIQMGVDYIDNLPIDEEAGESQKMAILYKPENGPVMFAIAILNDLDTVLRFENVTPFENIIDILIKKI